MTNALSDQPGGSPTHGGQGLPVLDRVNSALLNYSDKDWNYSRISLIDKLLESIDGPYVLKVDVLDLKMTKGRDELRSLVDEVKWGDRHSSQLGILEVVSLRINKALLEVTSDDYWNQNRPVLRIVKKEEVESEDITHAVWYQIAEVAGEDFDER